MERIREQIAAYDECRKSCERRLKILAATLKSARPDSANKVDAYLHSIGIEPDNRPLLWWWIMGKANYLDASKRWFGPVKGLLMAAGYKFKDVEPIYGDKE